MYPNPVTDLLNMNFTKSVKDNAVINIIDAKGSVVLSEVISETSLQNKVNLDLSNFTSGIYSVSITVDNKVTVGKNIIKH